MCSHMNGFEVGLPFLSKEFPCFPVTDYCPPDAKIFHNLEAWVTTRETPSSTRYLSQFELFQRHMTTAAYRIAAGADLPSTSLKSSKQPAVPQVFTSKITKTFLDAIYAFLDGLVLLASEESPLLKQCPSNLGVGALEEGAAEMTLQELLDLKDGVSVVGF